MLENLIVFVEEFSMEALLQGLLPKMLGNDVDFLIIRFQCKNDLLKKLPSRLQAYSSWLPDNWALLVLVDRDDDDCVVLKQQLEEMARTAGLRSKTVADTKRFQVVNRIVVEELESWFFGDWAAVQQVYPRVPANIPRKARFRNPDAITGGTWEALERVLKKVGYCSTGLRKLECARKIGKHMSAADNHSASFQAFAQAIDAVLRLD